MRSNKDDTKKLIALENKLRELKYKENSGANLSAQEYFSVAYLENKLGSEDRAIVYYCLSLSVDGQYEDSLNNLANIYIRKGNWELAASILKRLARCNIKYTEKYFQILINMRRYVLVSSLYKKNKDKIKLTIKLKYIIVRCLMESHQTELAKNLLDEAEPIVNGVEDTEQILKLRARISYLDGNIEGSLTHLSGLTQPDGEDFLAMGAGYLAAGDKDTAVSYFLSATEFVEQRHVASFALSRIVQDEEIKSKLKNIAMSALAERSISPLISAAANFTMFNLLDKDADYEMASTFLRAGNKSVSETTFFDQGRHRKKIDEIITDDSLEFFSKKHTLHKGLIHILGLPRVGSSLLEQLISENFPAHPCGELNVLGLALLNGKKNDGGARLRYEDHVYECYNDLFNSGSDSYVIDKQPFNYLHFGDACRLFANYKAIHIFKSKREVAWSLYKQWFASEALNWVYRWDDIGAYIECFESMMTYWRLKYPENLLEIDYVDLVNDTEAQLKKIESFLQIDRSAAKNIRSGFAKRTASNVQLTNGIEARYIDGAIPYMKFFPELEGF